MFTTTQQVIQSIQFKQPGTTPTDKMTTAGTRGLTMMYQVTGGRNSDDVDTSWPDRHQHQEDGDVCSVVCICFLIYFYFLFRLDPARMGRVWKNCEKCASAGLETV